MHEFRIAWRGHDLFDSIEDEGMTLSARACYQIACEIVSSIRRTVRGYVPEAWQDDSWASFDFPNLGQRVRCVVAMQDENDYSVSVNCGQGVFRSLFGRIAPEVRPESVAIVRNALTSNERFEILSEKSAASG